MFVVGVTVLAALCILLPRGIVWKSVWIYSHVLDGKKQLWQEFFSDLPAGRGVAWRLGLDQDLRT